MYLGIVEILVEYEGTLYGIWTTDDGARTWRARGVRSGMLLSFHLRVAPARSRE